MPIVSEWQLQEAKNRLSEVIRCAANAPQTITLHGKPAAVVISYEKYRKLNRSAAGLLDALAKAPRDFAELDLKRHDDTLYRDVAL